MKEGRWRDIGMEGGKRSEGKNGGRSGGIDE